MWVYNNNLLLYWHFRIYNIQITHIEFIHSKWLPSRPYSWNPRWGFLHHWQSANCFLDFRAFWTDQNGNFVLRKTYSKPNLLKLLAWFFLGRKSMKIVFLSISFWWILSLIACKDPPHVTCKTFRLAILRRNGSILWTFKSHKVCQVYPCSPKKEHGIWIKTTKHLVILVDVERFGFCWMQTQMHSEKQDRTPSCLLLVVDLNHQHGWMHHLQEWNDSCFSKCPLKTYVYNIYIYDIYWRKTHELSIPQMSLLSMNLMLRTPNPPSWNHRFCVSLVVIRNRHQGSGEAFQLGAGRSKTRLFRLPLWSRCRSLVFVGIYVATYDHL